MKLFKLSAPRSVILHNDDAFEASCQIAENLPEIVQPLLAPLYELFEFSELPMSTVSGQIARLRSP